MAEDLKLQQMDVKPALLNGGLEEENFMKHPEGCIDKNLPEFVCNLLKALYRLKQASRQWVENLNAFLCDLGFQNCTYDPSFYVKRLNKRVLTITLLVDDLHIAQNFLDAVQLHKSQMSTRIEIDDCGEAKLCLGLKISRNPQTTGLHEIVRCQSAKKSTREIFISCNKTKSRCNTAHMV